jgi:hypothetical protein
MRWETNTLHHTFRRKGHCRVVAVMGTTHNNNISTSPVAIRTEVHQRHPLGRAQGIIHNDPVASIMNASALPFPHSGLRYYSYTLPGVEWTPHTIGGDEILAGGREGTVLG